MSGTINLRHLRRVSLTNVSIAICGETPTARSCKFFREGSLYGVKDFMWPWMRECAREAARLNNAVNLIITSAIARVALAECEL